MGDVHIELIKVVGSRTEVTPCIFFVRAWSAIGRDTPLRGPSPKRAKRSAGVPSVHHQTTQWQLRVDMLNRSVAPGIVFNKRVGWI